MDMALLQIFIDKHDYYIGTSRLNQTNAGCIHLTNIMYLAISVWYFYFKNWIQIKILDIDMQQQKYRQHTKYCGI